MQKIKTFILSNKIIVGVIIIAIIFGAYSLFNKKTSAETRYVTNTAQKGSVTQIVSGTGQVDASNTIDLQPKSSGNISYVGVKVGENVKKGELIASIDTRDAKLALQNSQIVLDKLTSSPDSLTLIQKQNLVNKSYSDAWDEVSSFVIDSNSLMNNLSDLYSTGFLSYNSVAGISSTGRDMVVQSQNSYYDARNDLDKLINVYKTLNRDSSSEQISSLVDQAYNTSKLVSNAVKNTETSFNMAVDFLNYQNNSNTATTRANINSWINTSNTHANNILSSQNSIKENKQSLSDLVAGSNALDIKSAELTLESKQNAYDDCFIYAPFDGVIATLTAEVGQPSGSSIGTLITKQKVAIISLNEVDIAKIKLGQKATLTFDAIDGLSITGKVTEIDSVGTVSQGVVSYNVKISLDIDDSRIKPGMSINVSIITDMIQDVIVVPTSAVKTQNGTSYVQVFDAPLATPLTGVQGSLSATLPRQVAVETGLSDDTNTEITSGLKEGDIIVTKTIAGTTIATTSTTPSILNAVGGGNRTGGGGSAFRAVRGD